MSSGVVAAVLVVTLLTGGAAQAQTICVPDSASFPHACVGQTDGQITAEVFLDEGALGAGGLTFTSAESFALGAYFLSKDINVTVRRYADPQTGEVKLEVCVQTPLERVGVCEVFS